MAALVSSLRPLAAAMSQGASRRALFSTTRSTLRPLAATRSMVGAAAAKPRSTSLAVASARFSSAFAAARPSNGQATTRLVQLLEKEVEHEKGVSSSEEDKELMEFLESSSWKLDAKEGHDDVTLSKAFGNEKINVTFSLSEINRQDDQYDEELDQEQENDIEGGEDERGLSVNALVTCEKPGRGVLTYDVTFEDGDLIIQSANYYPSGDVAKMESVEAEWKRRALYGGPEFSELEDDLQDTFREYLEERGVDTGLAVFVARYLSVGEQKEYLGWLNRVMDYVKA